MHKLLLFFICLDYFSYFAQSDAAEKDPQFQYAMAVSTKVEDEGRTTDNLDAQSLTTLPIGIIKEIGTTKYIIAIDSARFSETQAIMSAYMAIDLPGSGRKIAFAAKNIYLNPGGISGGKMTRLMLITEHSIPIGPNIQLRLKPDGFNFVEWGCDGFKSVNLKGYFEFSENILETDPDQTKDKKVIATFECSTKDIHELIAKINITPFCIKGLSGFSFSVSDAVVDLSEITGSQGMTFPQGYTSSTGPNAVPWTGFYMRKLRVKLPKELSNGVMRKEIDADNFILDKTGVSGSFTGINILTNGEGNMSSWPFSIDNFSVNVANNKLNGGNMTGVIQIPALNNDDLKYNATLFHNPQTDDVDYSFVINPKSNFNFDLFKANVDLYPTSRIDVSKKEQHFFPTAVLNGKIAFSSDVYSTQPLEFEQLTFSGEEPYITNGIFSYHSVTGEQSKTAGFSCGINYIQLTMNKTAPKISVGVALNMSGNNMGFSVTTGVSIFGKITKDNADHLLFNYDKTTVDDINIQVNTQPFYLAGTISLRRDHPIFGNGFMGQLNFGLNEPVSLSAQATAAFGCINAIKYWYVDFMIPTVIPLGSSSMAIYNIKGGLSYHMGFNQASSITSRYVPNPSIGLGVQAGVTIVNLVNERTMNGDVLFELLFNTSGGLENLRLKGDICVLATVAERKAHPGKQTVYGTMDMTYDKPNKSLHAIVAAYINTSSVKAQGQTVFHFDPAIWYVYIGRPSSPFTATVSNLGWATVYLMIGNTLESGKSSANGLDNTKLSTGEGFGAGFHGGVAFSATQDIGFADAYADFAASIGLDIMIKGPNAKCNSQPAGLRGWYCDGNLFISANAGIGLQSKKKSKKKYEIIDINLQALLHGRLPKPTYLDGNITCHYKVVGGLVKGEFDLDFKFGDNCPVVYN